jgi:hypothetical protein
VKANCSTWRPLISCDRERGVPRYNSFREAFHKAPVRRFDQLSTNPAWAEEIRRLYDDDIDAVDLMIGLYSEPLPQGFCFSDTAFRVFLMASRRLKSDRFFTDDYNAEHYTKAGLQWIDDNSMKTMLLRHFSELEPALGPLENTFMPWARGTFSMRATVGGQLLEHQVGLIQAAELAVDRGEVR